MALILSHRLCVPCVKTNFSVTLHIAWNFILFIHLLIINSSNALFPIIPCEQAILPMTNELWRHHLTVDHRQDNVDRILNTASYRTCSIDCALGWFHGPTSYFAHFGDKINNKINVKFQQISWKFCGSRPDLEILHGTEEAYTTGNKYKLHYNYFAVVKYLKKKTGKMRPPVDRTRDL